MLDQYDIHLQKKMNLNNTSHYTLILMQNKSVN